MPNKGIHSFLDDLRNPRGMPLYAMRLLADSWAVVNVETGEVAAVDDVQQVGLSTKDAVEVACLLNRIEAHKPARMN